MVRAFFSETLVSQSEYSKTAQGKKECGDILAVRQVVRVKI